MKNVLAALLVAVVESSRTPSVFQTITLLSVVRSSSLMIGERTTMQQKPACLLYLFLLLQSRTAKMHVKYCAIDWLSYMVRAEHN